MYTSIRTWRPYVMTSCPLEQNLCGFKGLVEYSAIVNFQSKRNCSHQCAVLRVDYRVILIKMATTVNADVVFYSYFTLCDKY